MPPGLNQEEDQLTSQLENIGKKYGISLPGSPSVGPETTPTAAPPQDEVAGVLEGIGKKYGIAMPTQPPSQTPSPAPQPDLPRVETDTGPSVQMVPALPSETVTPQPPGQKNLTTDLEAIGEKYGIETPPPGQLPQAIAPTKKEETPSLAGEVPVGGKLGLLGAVVSAARAIDPASAMTGAGIWPGPDNPVWDAPEVREERAKVAQQAMEQALFPTGIPESKTLAHSVVRGVAESWPALVSLISLAGYAAPLTGMGVAAAMARPAIPFALTGLTEESPVAGAAKGAALGATLGTMHKVTAGIQTTALRWLARIAGGMGIGGGSAAISGAGPEEISRSAIIFGLFEAYGMAKERGARGAEKPGEWSIDWDWMEKNQVPKETIETLKTQPIESREFVGAVNEAAGVILDQFGRTARLNEVQQSLQKQPWERNAYEKLIADQARKEGREEIAVGVPRAFGGPRPTTPAPMGVTGAEVAERATVKPEVKPLTQEAEVKADLTQPEMGKPPAEVKIYQDENKWWRVEGTDPEVKFSTREQAEKAAARITSVESTTPPAPIEKWKGNLLEWSAPKSAIPPKTGAGRMANFQDFKGTIKTGEIDDSLPLTDKARDYWAKNKEGLGYVNMRGLKEEDVRSIISAVRRGEATVTVNRMGKLAFYKLKETKAETSAPKVPAAPMGITGGDVAEMATKEVTPAPSRITEMPGSDKTWGKLSPQTREMLDNKTLPTYKNLDAEGRRAFGSAVPKEFVEYLEGKIAEESAPTPAKEPWEMTLNNYYDAEAMRMTEGKTILTATHMKGINERHLNSIKEALIQGKPVPPEVLTDYPDLAPAEGAEARAEFAKKFGTAGKVGVPEGIVTKGKRTYDVTKAIEHNDLPTIIRSYGGFRPDAELLKNFAPEERKRLQLLSKKGAQGPDELFLELKANHPDQFGHFEDAADMLRSLVDGRAKRMLNREAVQSDAEAYDELANREAERYGLTPEEFEKVKVDAQREFETETTSEGGEGGAGADFFTITAEPESGPTKYRLKERTEGAFGLRPQEKPTTRLETRLKELQTDYPDIDRDQASIVLRTFPEAGNDQVANMVADPEMFRRMVESGLTAAGQETRGGEVQPGLPGMGRGDTLFKAGAEKAFRNWLLDRKIHPDNLTDDAMNILREEFERRRGAGLLGLTTDQIQSRLGKSGTVSEIDIKPGEGERYNRGWLVRLKNDQMAMVFESKDGTLELGPKELERVKGQYASLGITVKPGDIIGGSHKPMSFGSLIELARGEGVRTFDHEVWHMVEHWVLTDKERAAVIKKYGENEENRAEAYARWNRKITPDTIFQKIQNFFKTILKALTGYETAEDVFAKARSGEMFGREPTERRAGLPEGIAPAKYRISVEPTQTDRHGLIRPLMKPFDYLNDVIKGAQSLVAPGAISKEFREAAHVLRGHLGTMNRHGFDTVSNTKPERRMFDKMGVNNPNTPLENNVGMQFMSDMSQGRPVITGLEGVARKIQAENAKRVAWLEKVDAPLDTVREHYFGMLWTPESRRAFNQAVTEAVEAGRGIEAVEGGGGGQVMNLNEWSAPDKAWVKGRVGELLAQGQGSDTDASIYLAKRPFKGPEGMRKPKVFEDVMTGIEFGVVPVSNNPVDIFQIKIAEMDRSIYANGAIQEYKARGDIQINHVSKRVPDGWAKIDDRYGTVYGPYDPATGARPLYGYWIAKASVAEIINNSLSLSLYNNPYFGKAFKGVMATGNLLNQFQLMSAFHAGFTSLETQITAGSEVIKDIYGVVKGNRTIGDLGGTLKKYPMAMTRFATEGNRVLAEYANPSIDIPTDVSVRSLPDTREYRTALVARAAELAGGGFTMEHRFRTQWTDKMVKEWYGGQKIKAALRSPVVMTEMAMKPIMNYLVPRQKAAVFSAMVERIVEQNPDKSMNQLQSEFSEAWNRVDSRLGQVRYDRLFMRDGAKNAMQALLRAPGWTGGTILEVGGSQVDAVRFVKEWVETGKAPRNIPDRVAYTLSLLGTMAVANGLMTYLFTGEKPEGMDWFAFRTGQVDSKGRNVRFLMPSYMKDLFAWYQAPLHTAVAKTHPLWSMVGELARNKDYYNTLIRDPESSQAQQLLDMGTYSLKQFTPFGIRGMQQIGEYAKFSEEPGRFIAPQFGIMPAPRAYTNTAAQQVIEEYNVMTRAAYSTKETAEKKKLKADLIKMAQGQDESGFEEMSRQAVSEGKLTRQQVKEIISQSQQPPGTHRFTSLPLEWAIRAWKVASPQEREEWQPYFLKKVMGSKPEVLINLREPLVRTLENMGLSDAAQAISDLAVPERGAKFDLTALGISKPTPQTAEMAGVDAALTKSIEEHTAKMGEIAKPRKATIVLPSVREKKKKEPYKVLGL